MRNRTLHIILDALLIICMFISAIIIASIGA